MKCARNLIVELANTELSRDKRADKLTALSNAIKILTTLRSGMLAMIRDGEMARQDKLKAEKIEQMTAPRAGCWASRLTDNDKSGAYPPPHRPGHPAIRFRAAIRSLKKDDR
jgi:hypothetical protein